MLTFDESKTAQPLCMVISCDDPRATSATSSGGKFNERIPEPVTHTLYYDPSFALQAGGVETTTDASESTNYTVEDVKRLSLTERRRLRNQLESALIRQDLPATTYKTRLNEIISILPSDTPDRIYIAGASGVGKSSFSAQFVLEYHIKYPENKIYMYSTHQAEHAYSRLPIEYQELKTLLPDSTPPPPTVQDFKNSLVLFDDVDNLQDKNLQNAVNGLQSDLLANGRKYHVSVMIIAHQLMNYKQTRNILSECYRVVFFPQSSKYHVNRYLKTYAGIQKSDIDRIMNTRSRWICLQTTVPNIVMAEHDVFIL
jgi:hypothetical protein